MFQIFFKTFISIIVFSVWHGIVVMPVILSLVQPASFATTRARLGMEQHEHDKPAPPLQYDDSAVTFEMQKVQPVSYIAQI